MNAQTMRCLAAALLVGATACQAPEGPPDESSATDLTATTVSANAGAPRPWFEESAREAGLDFVHRSGHDGQRFLMPESAAGGAALFDMDGDGWLDVYLVQSAGAQSDGPAGNRLYHNRGGRNRGAPHGIHFEDVTESSGAGDTGYGMGVTSGDFDGDGDTDLYVTNVGANVLLENDGSGRFTDVTAAAGVGGSDFSSGAAFFDADGDGDLDLYVVNYLVWSEEVERQCFNRLGQRDYCDPNEYDAPAPDRLYRNNGRSRAPGESVTFTDISREAGLSSAFGNGLGVVTADFDGDGRSEVFVANDRMPDQLWTRGAGAGDPPRFEDRALAAGCAMDDEGKAKAGMGVAAADVDDDGDPDLAVVNYNAESDSFFRNAGSFFVDSTATIGLGSASRPFTRFGLGLVDFDNDGRLDLYEAAGRVTRQTPAHGDDPYAEPNLLFQGTGTGAALRFIEIQPRGGTSPLLTATSRAAVFGDVDNDGGVDILVVNRDGPVHLLLNAVPDRGRWISFRVLAEDGGDALGATVRLTVGERVVTRTVRSAYSYCAANDPRVHVGLGTANEVREVTVEWPGRDRPGRDRPGRDRPGRDRPGHDRPGRDRPGHDRPGRDRPGHDRPGHDRPGHDRPGATDGRAQERFGNFDADQIVTLRRGQGGVE